MTSKEKTKSLVNKATTDDRNPPSGYLLKELASRTMSIAECQTIEDLIVKKLSKNKPYIKYKALRIVKYLCETGSPNWRRAWQRNTDKLRDAQQFRGPPDPVYGDAPYSQVRKAAKDAMQAVFQQSTIDSSHIKNRIKGMDGGNTSGNVSSYTPSTFGSGSTGVYGGRSQHKKGKAPSAPGSWGKQMPGHGNTSYQPSVRSTTFQPLKSSGGYSNPAVLSGGNTHSRGKLDTRGAGKRKAGNVGGIWGGGDDDDNNDVLDSSNDDDGDDDDYSNDYRETEFASTSRSTSYNVPSPKKKLGSFGGNIKRKNKSASSGQFEKRWVDDIVKSGGVGCKVVDLPKYVRQFENLSQSHVLEYLDEKLEDSAWQKQGKALALIEALLKGKSSENVLDYFSQSPDNIQSLQNSKKSILRRKANAVIECLELDEDDDDSPDEEPVRQVKSSRRQQQQEPQSRDLLDMGGPSTGQGQPANDESDDDDDGDMFAGLKKTEEQDNDDLLNMGATTTQSAAQPASGGGMDLLNMMGDVDAVQAQANKPKKAEYKDIFGDLGGGDTSNNANSGGDVMAAFGGGNAQNAAAPAQTQQQTTTSAFGFDIGGGAQQQNSAPAQANGTSAFGFDLGGGGGNVQQSPAQPSAAQPATSAFGFDLGGSSSQSAVPQMQQQQQRQPAMGGGSSPMMTAQMMQQNAANMQRMQQMMQQMNMNPQMMNMMQQQMMQGQMMGNMQNMQQPQMNQQQQPNLFQQTLAGVGGAQPQRAPQTYGHNDPFAQMMSGGGGQPAPVVANRPKKAGPDPFADLALGSMK